MENIQIKDAEGRKVGGPYSVAKFIHGGNWIQLNSIGANRLFKERPDLFIKAEPMGGSETQLTLKEGFSAVSG